MNVSAHALASHAGVSTSNN